MNTTLEQAQAKRYQAWVELEQVIISLFEEYFRLKELEEKNHNDTRQQGTPNPSQA